MLRTTIAPKTAAQRERLLDALTQLADTDPLLRCEVDSITHEIILSFLGRVQLEVVSALLSEKYKLETVVKEPSVIYMERPLKAASHTIHIEVPPNPFWASIGLSVTPLSLGSGVQYESRVSLGYLNQSFQNAVRDGIRYGLEQGLFGWNVTDCKICFEYGLYYSPVSTPADFRSLAPIVLEQALKESGTQLLEPYLSFILYAPQEYLSRAYHDAPKYCATIETAQVKKDEVVFTGEIPARCIQAYRTDLAFYTNGQSVCLTELKGYQAAVGKPVIQPRRPNSRLDKVRYMFQKIM
jgi:ribosomal protection tetracycline resistance protein